MASMKSKTKKNPPPAVAPEASAAATPEAAAADIQDTSAAVAQETETSAAAADVQDTSAAAASVIVVQDTSAAVAPETSAAAADVRGSSVIEAAPAVHAPSDQPPKSPNGIALGTVKFRDGVLAELRAVLNLRPCNTHLDGFCGTRVAAALRNTTMEELVQDLEHFWDYDGYANVPPGTITFDTITNAEGESAPTRRYTDQKMEDSIAILRRVRAALDSQAIRLNRRYWWPDEYWEYLSHIMQAPILWIDCQPIVPGVYEQEFPFVLYLPTQPYVAVFATLAEVQPFLATRPRGETTVAHGAAFAADHYCALLPPDVTPNFAGPERIDPWD